jgi:hypothetical protein
MALGRAKKIEAPPHLKTGTVARARDRIDHTRQQRAVLTGLQMCSLA